MEIGGELFLSYKCLPELVLFFIALCSFCLHYIYIYIIYIICIIYITYIIYIIYKTQPLHTVKPLHTVYCSLPISWIILYFAGIQEQCVILKGHHPDEELQALIHRFADRFCICQQCGLPETILHVSNNQQLALKMCSQNVLKVVVIFRHGFHSRPYKENQKRHYQHHC